MQRAYLLLVLVQLLSFALPCSAVHAATVDQPAWLRTEVQQLLPWQEGLRVQLRPHEQRCRERYGTSWQQHCSAYVGEHGKEVQGITLTPPVRGRWTWEYGTALRFTPEEPLRPDTQYTLSLSGLRLPAVARLVDTQQNFRSMPLAVSLQQHRFWIDPSPRQAHVLTAQLSFTYPVARGTHEPLLLTPPQGLQLGTTEYVWNADRDSVTLSAPVTALPEKEVIQNLRVPGVDTYAVDQAGGRHFTRQDKGQGATFGLRVAGRQNLYKVEKLGIVPVTDKDLNKVFELQVQTSVYTRPEDVLDKLTVVQLPRSLDAHALRPYDWSLAPTVPASALNKGKKIVPRSLQPDNTPVSRMSFALDVDAGSYVLVYVDPALTSATGLPLNRQWRQIFHVDHLQSSLNFLQPGNILPLKGKQKVDVYSTDITEIHWEISRIRDPFLALAAASRATRLSAEQGDSDPEIFDTAGIVHKGVIPVPPAAQGKACFSSLDVGSILRAAQTNGSRDDGTGLLQLRLQGYKGSSLRAEAQRMLLVTDLGILAKTSVTGTQDVFILSLSSGRPVADAGLEVLGANGRPVATARSDEQGHAVLPSLHGLTRDKRPVAVVARLGNDLAWLPLDDDGLQADYSAYDVSGRTLSPEGISSFVFSQRGIYRPGETVHFGILNRRTDWQALPQDLPLTARLYGPSGVEILKQTIKANSDGLAQVQWASAIHSPSGRYRLDVELKEGVITGSAVVRLEEFQPDTLAIKASLQDKPAKGWIKSGHDPLNVTVRLDSLSGLPAAGHKVQAEMRVRPALFRFQGYEDYVFHDAVPFKGQAAERALPAVMTDAKGTARLTLPDDLLKGGSVHCSLLLEGFEADGGRAVSMPLEALISPQDFMLGWKPVGAVTNPQFLSQGKPAALEFIAVDSELQQVPAKDVQFIVYNRRFVTSLVTDARGEYRYDETPLDSQLHSEHKEIKAGTPLRYSLPTDKAGEFLLAVRQGQSTLALIPFTVAGERLAQADGGLASSILRLKANKTVFEAGEDIELFLQLPYDGTGLITLERDTVTAASWFTAKAGESLQKIRIPADFEGRGFINVTYMRAATSPDVYTEPSTAAVLPFMAGIRKHRMEMRVQAPASVQPASTLQVKITAAHKGMAAVFAVDEGVLQLTSFATPAPLHYLLEDRALDVKTMHALNRLMPDHGLLQGRIPPFGGGLAMQGGRFHNPFRRADEPPLASWTVLEVGPQEKIVEIPVPSYYTGKLRIMAVGGSATTAGAAAASTTVSAPLMLTPRLPLTVSPADRFVGTLIAANSTDTDMRITLNVDAGSALTAEKALPQGIVVKAGQEEVISLPFVAGQEPQAAEVCFTATDATQGITVKRSTGISVRPASHLRLSTEGGLAKSSQNIPVSRELFRHDASHTLSVSALPLTVMQTFSHYLGNYPYGCLEQNISRAFGVAVLQKRPELLPKAGHVEKTLHTATTEMRSHVKYGGLSLWIDDEPSLLLTAYGVDLLLTMREQGLGIPEALLHRLCDSIAEQLDTVAPTPEDVRAAAYGIYVLTREGRVTTQLLERLLDSLKNQDRWWQEDITAALLASAQRIMHVREHQTIPFRQPAAVREGSMWFDDLAQQSLYAALLARHFPERVTAELIDRITEQSMAAAQSGQYATFSAAQALRALTALHTATAPALEGVTLRCAEGHGPTEPERLADGGILQLNAPLCRAFRLEMPPAAAPLYWQLRSRGYDRTPPAKAEQHGITVSRVYRDMQGNTVTAATQGQELEVLITARADGTPVQDCVIVDLLPGGMEMVLPRQGETAPKADRYVHTDRRDDRMIIFTDLTEAPFQWSYRVRAVNRGVFSVPAIQAEAMYNRSIHGNAVGGRFEIR